MSLQDGRTTRLDAFLERRLLAPKSPIGFFTAALIRISLNIAKLTITHRPAGSSIRFWNFSRKHSSQLTVFCMRELEESMIHKVNGACHEMWSRR